MGVRIREKVKGSKVFWVFVHHHGQRRSVKVGSKPAAKEVARKIEAKLTLGGAILHDKKPSVPTLEEYYESQFKKTYMQATLKPSSCSTYEKCFRLHILPALGRFPLDEIPRPQMEEFVAGLVKKDLAKDTIRLTVGTLGVLYNQAVEHGVVSVNPACKLTKFFRNAPKRHAEIQPLSPQEVPLFLQTALKHSPEQYPIFLALIHTGMRSGELAALKWGDLSFNGKYITVRRNFVEGQMTTTKTDRIRKVDMSDALMEVLLELRRKRQEQWLTKGHNEIPELVFCNDQGEPIGMRHLPTTHFKRCLKKAGLSERRLHDLRHTFATLLIMQGESLAYVRDQLGHASIKMTVDKYTHWIPGSNRQAVNRLPSLNDLPLADEAAQAL